MCWLATFRLFGPSHVGVLAATAGLAAILLWLARRVGSDRLTRAIALMLAVILLVNDAVYTLTGLAIVGWGEVAARYLPLHICGVAVYLTALTLLTRRQLLFEVAFYWGLAGTMKALLAPELDAEFPQYWFFQFFIRHSGIVVGVLFAAVAMGMRPRRGSAWRVFVATNVWLLIVAGMNLWVGGNYMYLRRAPEVADLASRLRWPWYIIIADLFLLAAFWLLETVGRRR